MFADDVKSTDLGFGTRVSFQIVGRVVLTRPLVTSQKDIIVVTRYCIKAKINVKCI